MKVLKLNQPIDFCALLDDFAFLDFLKSKVSWIFGAIDLGTIENLKTIIPDNAMKLLKQKKLEYLPLTPKVYPLHDCFIVPNLGMTFSKIFSKISELNKVSTLTEVTREAIGKYGLSIIDPAGIDSEGRLIWALQLEDDLVEFFIYSDLHEQELCNAIKSFNFDYSIIETKNPGVDRKWLTEF
jgi:hypothetical protein